MTDREIRNDTVCPEVLERDSYSSHRKAVAAKNELFKELRNELGRLEGLKLITMYRKCKCTWLCLEDSVFAALGIQYMYTIYCTRTITYLDLIIIIMHFIWGRLSKHGIKTWY